MQSSSVLKSRNAFCLFLVLGVASKTVSGVSPALFINAGIGYHDIGSKELSTFTGNRLGQIQQGNFLLRFEGGVGATAPQKGAILFFYSYNIGKHVWENAFGSGEDVNLYLRISDIGSEIRFLSPFFRDINPYLGVGKTISCNLVDSNKDGFLEGAGDYHFSFGFDVKFRKLFAHAAETRNIRLGCIYRPDFSFKKFKVGESFPVVIEGKSLSVFISHGFFLHK